MNKIEYLILSSTLDFSTDYICYEMEKRKLPYLRLNRDRFSQYQIKYDMASLSLYVYIKNEAYLIEYESLKSVYFRSPVFLRTNKSYSVERQLYRSQWSSFIRNLIVFDQAKWLNHPVEVYKAENKMYQLKIAQKVGLRIPDTIVTNSANDLLNNEEYAVKALDTPLFYEAGQEMFTYSTIARGDEIKASSIQDAPVIIQKWNYPVSQLSGGGFSVI